MTSLKYFFYAVIIGCSPCLHTEEISQQKNVSTEASSTNQSEATAKLIAVIENSFKTITAIQNTIIQVTMLLQKYGKNIERKADAVKELQNAPVQLENLIQIQMKPIAHYFQQDLSTIPAEAHQEIYAALETILRGSNKLLDALKYQIKNNFAQPLDLNFLTTKSPDLLSEDILNPDALLEYCVAVMQNTADVYATGNTIGLTRWNKVARTIDRYLVQPCGRYRIPEIALLSTFVTVSALYLYWVSYGKRYLTPQQKAEHEKNKLYNESMKPKKKGAPVNATNTKKESIQGAPVNATDTKKESIHWLTKMLNERLGPVPATDANGLWVTTGATEEQLTLWNRTMCILHNCLPNHDPITNFIYNSTISLGTYYGVQLMWPFLKHSVKNWWQQQLGGSSAEVAPVGTWEYEPDITLDHVIGLQHIKDRLAPAIDYAENPEKYAQTASAIPTNYVLYGLRRTGKSFFAKAIAGEMKKLNPRIKVLNVPCDAFREFGVQQTIDLIRSYAPCVAFVDEVDLGNFARSLDRRTTGELLKALGEGNISPDPSRPVFLFFATNKLEAIDTSLASLGRFGASILFTNPNFIDRLQFIFAKLQSIGLNPQNFDINKIAEKTEGNSLEEIAYCITLAKQKALGTNDVVSTELIMAAINEILYGIYPEFPHELHKEAIAVLSAHFAGKALVTALTESNELLDTVSICRRKLPLIEDENAAFSGKPTRQPKYNYGIMLTRKETVTENNAGPMITKAYYMRILAGVVAEEMILGKATHQCHAEPWNDDSMIVAYQAALKECSEGGLYWYFDTQMSDAQKGEFFAKAKALIEGYKQEARALLEQHREALNVLIRALKLFGTLHDGIVMNIIENPAAITAHIDEIEKKQQEEYQRRMAEQQTAPAA